MRIDRNVERVTVGKRSGYVSPGIASVRRPEQVDTACPRDRANKHGVLTGRRNGHRQGWIAVESSATVRDAPVCSTISRLAHHVPAEVQTIRIRSGLAERSIPRRDTARYPRAEWRKRTAAVDRLVDGRAAATKASPSASRIHDVVIRLVD